jgi:hypothetical protein
MTRLGEQTILVAVNFEFPSLPLTDASVISLRRSFSLPRRSEKPKQAESRRREVLGNHR